MLCTLCTIKKGTTLYTQQKELTGDGLSFSLSVVLRRLFLLLVREEDEAEGAIVGFDDLSDDFFNAARDS